MLYMQTTLRNMPIRKINIGINGIESDSYTTVNLFISEQEVQRERKLQETVLAIKGKYGKNSMLKGMNFKKRSTARARNKTVGGHNGE